MHGQFGWRKGSGLGSKHQRLRLDRLLVTSLLLLTSTAMADVDMAKLVQRWRLDATSTKAHTLDPFRAMTRRSDGVIQLLVQQKTGAAPVAPGRPLANMVRIRDGKFAWAATPEEVGALVDARPDLRVTWSAPKHVLLDKAVALVHADVAQNTYGLTGKGVVVGIVDTGLDVSHRDLRDANGKSRIAWLLDMSRTPVGLHPELEEAQGCNVKTTPCAVYSGADLDELIANSVAGDEPRDTFGHGTHVASLAAGNGLASPVPKYVGLAPDATVVAVRATRDDSGLIEDPDILKAVGFIFDVADNQLKLPAVVNLSLGGDFGAHDGTSELERELSNYVGAALPGHSIVVAAGNSGGLYQSQELGYPSPFGIHAVAQVPYETSVRVPILVAASAAPTFSSQLYIWVAARPGDRLKVGLDTGNRSWIAPVDLGDISQTADPTGKYSGVIQNGVTESDDPESIDHSGALVVISGPFDADQVLALRFEGHGTASIWVQASGGIDPSLNGIGAIIPGAQREGTISVPATSPNLIAVGATLNHLQWKDIGGTDNLASRYIANWFRQNEVLPFSSAGPTAVDVLKPDLVAPGGYVAGAMSSLADPRTDVGANAMFAGDATTCHTSSVECLIVDQYHALSSGTSMASPIVTGAVALLLQRDRNLTQSQILRALQAGANTVFNLYASPSQVGAGLLDVENTLLALDGAISTSAVSTVNSWIGLGISYTRPDPNWPIAGLVHLRDATNRAVDVDTARLSLEVQNGHVVSGLKRETPGYYRFTLAGEARTAGLELRVNLLIDNQRVLEVERTIAVDMPNTREAAVAGRGCAVNAPLSTDVGPGLLFLGLGVAVARARRRRACLTGGLTNFDVV